MKRLLGILTLVLVLYGTVLVLDDPYAGSVGAHRSRPPAGAVGHHHPRRQRRHHLGRHRSVHRLGRGPERVEPGRAAGEAGAAAAGHHDCAGRRVLIGLFQGLLITKLKLQPFIVTLCGLFIFRGAAQLVTLVDHHALGQKFATGFRSTAPILEGSSKTVGIGNATDLQNYLFLVKGRWLGVPMTFWLLLVVAAIIFVLLHRSVYGRYLYAIGYNEQAARYAGIRTDRYKILAYVLCAALGVRAGSSTCSTWGPCRRRAPAVGIELYAITGAVLGGCSLRGGEGTVPGVLLGTAVLPLLNNLCIFAGVPSDLEFMVIGVALLLGTIVDEVLKRRSAKRISRWRSHPCFVTLPRSSVLAAVGSAGPGAGQTG